MNFDNMSGSAGLGLVTEQILSFRFLFYMVTPNETMYEAVEEVPNYFVKVGLL